MNFISEIASSHRGKYNDVLKLSNLHLKSNSNYLKYQIFKTDNLYSKRDKINYEIFKKLEINYYKWEKLINKFKNKTKLILEPFDIESYNFCKKFKKSVLIKISTSETDNFELIKDALRNFKKVFINLSGYKNDEIKFIMKKFKKKKYLKKIILMYGFQSYPSDPEKIRFNLFKIFYKNKFTFGFADHSIFGISKELITCLNLALNLKCSFFEKHVCLNIKEKPNDYISSVHFTDLNILINYIKQLKKINLNIEKNSFFSKDELKYAEEMHKKAFFNTNVKKNSKINKKNLIFLRSKNKGGIKRIDLEKKIFFLKKNVLKNNFLTKSHIK